MEPQITDFYNEHPYGINVIERLNHEYDELLKKIDEKDNEIRKRKIDDVNQINKKMKLLSLETSLNDFKENYTEFVYDLCNSLNLRKINMNSFDNYLLKNFNLGNAYYVLNNSKYLSKYNQIIITYPNYLY